ncbi:MAG: hypothetical protein KDA91_00365 [Planctomycetaceae bacterium]|nr:hypothetical protein [Planctomycetaceae bacterium]
MRYPDRQEGHPMCHSLSEKTGLKQVETVYTRQTGDINSPGKSNYAGIRLKNSDWGS